MDKKEFITLNKKLKNIDNLSLNELKYLYNYLINKKRIFLDYQEERKKKSLITKLYKLIYVSFFTIIILHFPPIKFINIIILTIIILLGAIGFHQIDQINNEINRKNYINYLNNIEEHIKKLQLTEEKTNNKSLTPKEQLPLINTSQKNMSLTRVLKKGYNK